MLLGIARYRVSGHTWRAYSPKCVEGLFSAVRVYPVHLSRPGLSRSISTHLAAVAACHPYLILAMRIASTLGKSLSLLRSASCGSPRSRGVMILSIARQERASASTYLLVVGTLVRARLWQPGPHEHLRLWLGVVVVHRDRGLLHAALGVGMLRAVCVRVALVRHLPGEGATGAGDGVSVFGTSGGSTVVGGTRLAAGGIAVESDVQLLEERIARAAISGVEPEVDRSVEPRAWGAADGRRVLRDEALLCAEGRCQLSVVVRAVHDVGGSVDGEADLRGGAGVDRHPRARA